MGSISASSTTYKLEQQQQARPSVGQLDFQRFLFSDSAQQLLYLINILRC